MNVRRKSIEITTLILTAVGPSNLTRWQAVSAQTSAEPSSLASATSDLSVLTEENTRNQWTTSNVADVKVAKVIIGAKLFKVTSISDSSL